MSRASPHIAIHSPYPSDPSSSSFSSRFTIGWPAFLLTSATSRPASAGYGRLPTHNSGSPASRRRVILGLLAATLILLAASGWGHARYRGRYTRVASLDPGWDTVDVDDVAANATPEQVDGDDRKAVWGWTEAMGWRQADEVGLAELGPVAEQRYRLNAHDGEEGMTEYFERLHDFILTSPSPLQPPLLVSLVAHLPPSHRHLLPRPPASSTAAPQMISYKTIHQTDRVRPEPLGDESQAWADLNASDGWRLNFMDDRDAQTWVEAAFGGSDVEWAWRYMHRGVLRADFLRYLLPLVEGGVYSDVDTRPLRPIEQWGHVNLEILDLSATDGAGWRSTLSTFPSVVVAIDVDVHAHPTWEKGWPRPLGICQWTLSSAPSHPILVDAARRVVNATRVVEQWEGEREAEIARLEQEQPQGWEKLAKALGKMQRNQAMTVMEWTGPGLFTDSVLAFLLVRYNVTWHRLRGLDHPLRIGDVLVLPITAFSPGGEPDFRAQGPDSPQANVLHDFRGSWKQGGT